MFDLTLSQSLVNLVFYIGSSFLFILLFYIIFKGKLKKFVIFDLALIISLSSLSFARLLGIINNREYYSTLTWSLSPFQEYVDRIGIIKAFPWEFIKFHDGNVIIWGFFPGALIGVLIIYLISNRQKHFLDFLDNSLMAFVPSMIIMYIGVLVSQSYFGKTIGMLDTFITSIGEERSNLILIELIILIVSFSFVLYIKPRIPKAEGLVTAIFTFSQGLSLLILGPLYDQIRDAENFNWIKILGIIITAISVVLFYFTIRELQMRKSSKYKRQNPESGVVQDQHLVTPTVLSDIELERQKSSVNKFFGSFKWRKK